MLDPRIAARLLDPAALRPAALGPEEVAAALGPAPLTPELPLLSSSLGTGEAAGPEGSPAAGILLPAAALDQGARAGADTPPSWVAAPELPLAAGSPAGGPGPRVAPGDEAWFEGPSLIEPSALLPSADPTAREPATPGEPAWPSAARSPSPPPSPAGGSSGGPGGDPESLAALAPRLMQAVERLEAVAEALARQAERPPSPMPRPFRGRAVD